MNLTWQHEDELSIFEFSIIWSWYGNYCAVKFIFLSFYRWLICNLSSQKRSGEVCLGLENTRVALLLVRWCPRDDSGFQPHRCVLGAAGRAWFLLGSNGGLRWWLRREVLLPLAVTTAGLEIGVGWQAVGEGLGFQSGFLILDLFLHVSNLQWAAKQGLGLH